jgi:hypothetical protein
MQDGYRQIPLPQPMMGGSPKGGMYGGQVPYSDSQDVYSPVAYAAPSGSQHAMHYTTMPPPVGAIDQPYASTSVFPTPPMQQQTSHPETSPPESHCGNNELADLLGSLKVDERGTGTLLFALCWLGQTR